MSDYQDVYQAAAALAELLCVDEEGVWVEGDKFVALNTTQAWALLALAKNGGSR